MINNCNITAEYILSQAKPPVIYPPPLSLTNGPHEFKNVTIPAGESIWTVPLSAQSPISRFQITVRNEFDSDVMLRAVGISTTQFKISVPLAVNRVTIFVNPIKTSST